MDIFIILYYIINMSLNYQKYLQIIKESAIDLSSLDFLYPWDKVMVSLLLIESKDQPGKKIILPKNQDLLKYLKRMHLQEILKELAYIEEAEFDSVEVPEHYNLNLQELSHCKYRDEFDARLGHFLGMFLNFGMELNDAKLATAIVGELGNNVFDHNLGKWPTDVSGCIIAAQNFPKLKKIEFAIGDPGIGFLGSLKAAFPELDSDIKAIKKGLAGNTGRIGENRGNGLKYIQSWTIKNFSGMLTIHSGGGVVEVSEEKTSEYQGIKILGTLAQFVIYYK